MTSPDDQAPAFRVEDVFHLPGRGSVLAGVVGSGSIAVGERLIARSPGAALPVRVLGIERERDMRDSADAGESVALLVDGLDPAALRGGLVRRPEGGFRVVDLTLVRPLRPWWQFWKPWA